jgi:molybdopterin-guanine dinucleotide biosynthesis protein A
VHGLERSHVLVLAAGRGSRMGGPKALMMVNGRPWWQHQQDRLSTLGLPVTWVVSPEVDSQLHSSVSASARVVVSDPARPMFSSILAGIDRLRACPPESLFILPVDCPAPHPSVWQKLAGHDKPAVPVAGQVRGHPVYLPWIFITSTIDSLMEITPERDSLRLDRILSGVACEVPVMDASVAVNLNSPEALLAWMRC